MIHITDKSSCCGCTACASVCANRAITMKPDVLGFLYPEVDETKCTNCGLCDKVCAFNDHYSTSHNFDEPIVVGARHKQMNEIATSRSGAAFIAISDVVLRRGGVVYGAGYKDHFRVVHKCATNATERNEFKGSKYVQSDLEDTFLRVKQDLKDGRTVLFSGTGCQTAGLASFLGEKLSEKLILVDIVCHGVPSPYIWRDYLDYLEKKNGAKIVEVDFRDKEKYGWSSHRESFVFEGKGKKILTDYTYLFYKHIMLRHSCGVCPFTNTRRTGDITIADFWGWQKTDKNFNADNKGISLSLINTEKGKTLFDEAKADLNVIDAKLENCLQNNLRHPSVISPERNNLEADYARFGFEYVYKKYCVSPKDCVKRFLSKVKVLVKNGFR